LSEIDSVGYYYPTVWRFFEMMKHLNPTLVWVEKHLKGEVEYCELAVVKYREEFFD
jgi:hypothetical protein